jgi:hypothetical protein
MSDDAEYVVQYLDGPMAGSSDRRALVGAKPESRIDAIAAVEGLESTYRYELVQERSIDGEILATYRFDAADSDPVEPDTVDGPL